MKKRVLSLFMALALSFSMTPTVAFAEEAGAVTEQEAQSGEGTADVYSSGEDAIGNDSGDDTTAGNIISDVSGGDVSGGDAGQDAAVQAAQALIDALPESITAENADELQAQLIAIDKAMDALDEAQTAKLDMTRYENICAALATFVAVQNGGHTNHPICGTTCTGHEDSHAAVTDWTPLSYVDGKLMKNGVEWKMDGDHSYELETGNYYLETDIEIVSYTPPEDNQNLPRIKISGNVSLCLNGHNITQDNGVCAISIPSGSLSLCDCASANTENGYITSKTWSGVSLGKSSFFNMYGGIIKDCGTDGVSARGTFNMYGGTITGNATGVVVGGNGFGGTFNMYGGEIIDNKGNLGGGVYVLEGTFTMSGGKINGNNASTGGGVYVANGTFTMSGGEITGNSADKGGGVYVANGTFTMSGGKITGNNTADPTIKNGNVYVDAGATFKVSGMAKIYENWINSDTKTETGVYEAGSAGFVCNVYLPSGKTITIGDSGLEDGASIGVTYGGTINADTDATIATGADNGYSTGSITSDNTSYHVWRVGDEVKLTAASLQEHPICGGTCTDGKHSNEVWKGISDLSQITSDGNYYLTDNVQLTDKWYFPSVTACPDVSNVKLCLNGKTITGASGFATIMVKDGSSLDITDCADSQESIGKITHASGDGCGIDVSGTLTLWNGAITGNNAGKNGGGVCVASSGTFTMNGGTITGNNAGKNGGGVCVASSSSFTMNGGVITGNNAGKNGGGVCVVASSGTFTMNGGTITGNNSTNGAENIYSGGVYVASRGIFTVSGEVNITNNWKNGKQNDEGIYVNDPDYTDSKAGNVYLAGVDATVATITIGAAGLTEKAKIGVSKAISNLDAGNVYIIATNATDEDMKYFTPDVPDKYFITSDGEGNLKLGMHQHSWTYTLSDDATITATCSNADTCPDTKGGSVTIKAPVDLIYDSVTKDARVISHGWLGKAVADIEISYKDANGDLLNGEPINVGTYIASITLTNEDNTSVTAEVEFTIEAVELTNLTVTAGAGGNYDGSEKRPTVTVKNGDALISPDEYEVTYSDNINAGTAKVTVKSTEGSNYKISGSTTFTIDKATITVIPDAGQSKIYGNDDPELTYDFSGAVNNETPAFTGVLSRTVGEDTGDYAINIGDLKLADNGNFKVSNYELKLSSTEVNFTINRRPVTITGITANNKTYDGTTDATFDWSQVKFEGLLDKDSLLINEIQGSFGDANVGKNKTVKINSISLDGESKSNYTLTADGQRETTANIDPKELTITDATVVNKTYDGTTKADVTGVTFDGFVNGETSVDYTVSGIYADAAVGTGKDVTVTVELAGIGNYTLPKNSYTKAGCEISKATVSAPTPAELNIINKVAKTYTFALSDSLPKLVSPMEYGKLQYSIDGYSLDSDYYTGSNQASIEDGQLNLPILAAQRTGEVNVGTITVKVTSDNVDDFSLTINVTATDKIVPKLEGTLTLSSEEITYGDTLSRITTISGTMKDGSKEIPGKFTWVDGTIKPAVGDGTYSATWKFTPDDTETYEETTGTVTIKVNKAAQSGAVSMDGYTYNDTPATPTLTDRKGDNSATVTYYYSTTDTNEGGTKWENIDSTTLNAGTYYMYAVIGATENYSEFTTPTVEFVVKQATPVYTEPTGVTAKYGQKLSEITLTNPEGNMDGEWSWEAPETVLNKTGEAVYYASFKPANANYAEVTGIAIRVSVEKGDGKNLATVELKQAFNDSSDQTYTPDWNGLPDGQTWSYDYASSVSNESAAKLTKLEISAENVTYAVSGGKAGDKLTVTLKASCENYEDFTITLNITITKAIPTGEPDYTKITTGDKTLADAKLTVGTLKPAEGILEWVDADGKVLADDTKVEVNKTYTWRFTPTDDNYESLTGGIELYHVDLPAISAQPKDASVKAGERAVFEVTATGTDLTYQWQIDRNDGRGFVNLKDATGASYMSGVTDTDCNGFKYQCVISNAAGSVTTETAILTVTVYYTITATAGEHGSISPSGAVEAAEGSSQTFAITADAGYEIESLKVDGTVVEAAASYTFTDVRAAHTIEVTFKHTPYRIIDGADSSWTQNVDGSLVIRGNGEFSEFQKVLVDGIEIAPENYTATEGSTIITLKSEFLSTLSEGSHSFEIVWTDGTASTNFTVARNTSGNNGGNNNNNNNSNNNSNNDSSNNAGSNANTTDTTIKAPKTGDTSNDALWVVLLAVASVEGLFGFAEIFVRRKKSDCK